MAHAPPPISHGPVPLLAVRGLTIEFATRSGTVHALEATRGDGFTPAQFRRILSFET